MPRSTRRRTALPTYRAREVLEELSDPFWAFSLALGRLEEQDLLSLVQEARRRADDHQHVHLNLGIATAAELELQVIEASKSSNGIWHASLDVIEWAERGHVGKGVASYHKECEGRDAAVEAARQLIVEHAGEFSASTTLEARVIPDIQWRIEQKIDAEPHF